MTAGELRQLRLLHFLRIFVPLGAVLALGVWGFWSVYSSFQLKSVYGAERGLLALDGVSITKDYAQIISDLH